MEAATSEHRAYKRDETTSYFTTQSGPAPQRRMDSGTVATAATALALFGAGLLRNGRSWPLMLAGLGVGAMGLRRYMSPSLDQGIKVAKAVTIDRPREEVYRRWRAFEALPRVLRHVERVERLDGRRLRFTARLAEHTPSLGWTVDLIEDRPGELIHWHSIPKSIIHNEGVVLFMDAPGGRGTEMHVRLSYRPTKALGGREVARIFRPVVAREIQQDLRRFKQLMETGEVATSRMRRVHEGQEAIEGRA